MTECRKYLKNGKNRTADCVRFFGAGIIAGALLGCVIAQLV